MFHAVVLSQYFQSMRPVSYLRTFLIYPCIFCICTLSCFFSSVPEIYAAPRSLEALKAIKDDLYETGVAHGDIPAIYGAQYVSVMDASMSMAPSDHVFIVFFPTGPKIYPQRILVWHEVVNELIQGVPYIVTYSPITGSLAVYLARLNNVSLVFDNQGSLYNNNSVLIDRNTGSLWLQMLGMAFDGPLTGRGLTPIPAWWTTWAFASALYPDAPVLAPPRGAKKPYGRDPYGSYASTDSYYSSETIMYPLTHPKDSRMYPKTRVFGLEYASAFVAIDDVAVTQLGLINFHVGATPMLAVYDPRIGVIRVFNRFVWNEEALFAVENGTLIDIETRTIWSFDGKALKGKLTSASLEEYFGITAFWFAWAALHPETFVVPGPNDVPPEALIKGHKTKGFTN